jgi:two-component system, cell cycle response regulator DivK
VLYIEDNEDNVYMLKMRLELLGDFEVLAAEDGQKGCEMAATEQPDIILMDLEMPVVDGWEATRRLKSNAQTRDIPVIALSAHALAGEREKALAAGWQRVRQQADRIRSTGRDHAACSRAPQVRLPSGVCASETAFAPTRVLLGSMGSWCRSLRSSATPKLRCAASIRSIECLHRSLKSCLSGRSLRGD